jgi:hypothetical protein
MLILISFARENRQVRILGEEMRFVLRSQTQSEARTSIGHNHPGKAARIA